MSDAPLHRLACLTPGCPNTIQPATAARTGGYCGPCAGKRAREARDAYVRANRKDVDRYIGVTDSVDLLRLMHTPPKPDPLINLLPPPKTFEELYLSLTRTEAQRMMKVASELLSHDEHQADDIAKCLAAFTDFTLDPMLQDWLDHDRSYPPLIFRRAGPNLRDRLTQSLKADVPLLRADHALSALAWIGDEQVIEYLRRVDTERPGWADKLYIRPTGYAQVAGWDLLEGGRRELTFQTCLAVHVTEAQEPGRDDVWIMQYRSDACPWCKCRLANLVAADLGAPPLDALNILGRYIEIVTCPVCTCFGPVHGHLDADGHGHWAAENIRPDILPENTQAWEPSPWSKARVSLSERRPMHAADWCLPTTLSQIGGFPAWVQDVEYPSCSKCRQTMAFVAQIDQAAFRGYEGVYYAFVCEVCRTTATTYQQT